MSRLLPDDGRVAIAVATTGTTAEGCLAQARAAVEAGADVVELRADLLGADPSARDVVELAGALATRTTSAPLLVTVRTTAEGGGARLDDDAYRALLPALAEGLAALPDRGRPAALDVELARGRTAGLVARAHAAGLDAVVSSHDVGATPPDAVMPRGPHDVARLLGVTARASEELDVPVVTMSMGGLGAVSRVSGAVFGSALTFATAGGAPSAPGQLPVERVRAALELLPGPSGSAFAEIGPVPRRDRS